MRVHYTTVVKAEALTCSYRSSSSVGASPKSCHYTQLWRPLCRLPACCLRRSTAMYNAAMTIPPFWLLQANYASTILGVQYDNSMVSFYAILRCLWQCWLRWCPSTNLQIPFDTIPRTPFDDSADTLWRFCGYPLTNPRISPTMLLINCGLPTRCPRGFCKVSCVTYCISWNLNLAPLPQ